MARKIPRLAQTKIRLPAALRRDLRRRADNNKRPLNAEIIRRLEASCRNEDVQAAQLAIATTAASNALEVLGLDVETVKRIAAGELSYRIEPTALPEGTKALIRTVKIAKPPAPTNKEEN